jgi:hypothetical protein
MTPSCGTCLFARPEPGDVKLRMRCCRHAPLVAAAPVRGTSPQTLWPLPERSDWCGEYQPGGDEIRLVGRSDGPVVRQHACGACGMVRGSPCIRVDCDMKAWA